MQFTARITTKDTASLRALILAEKPETLRSYGLEVLSKLIKGRPHGWSKMGAVGEPGVVNFHWDAGTKTLIARGITRRDNKPGYALASFLHYVLVEHKKRVHSITITPF
jgi:hypothetical protein